MPPKASLRTFTTRRHGLAHSCRNRKTPISFNNSPRVTTTPSPRCTTGIRIAGEPSEAQDLLHDLFASLPRRAANYRPDSGRAIGWLLTAARNLALDHVRGDKRRRELLNEAALEPEKPFGHNTVDRTLPYADEIAILRGCVGNLNDGQRRALELAYFDGLTHDEISTLLSEPLGTIKARIRRGLLAVKSCVEEQQ